VNEPLSREGNDRSASHPLVVDLDGTLTPTDTLIESILQLIKEHPATLLKFPVWLLKSRAWFKSRIAERVSFSAASLPINQPLLEYLENEKAGGRRIILATAAHRSIAEAVAGRFDLFDSVLASDATRNLKGREKLKAIKALVGGDFGYAGDSSADLPIWAEAKGAVLVGASARIAKKVRSHTPIEREFPRKSPGVMLWLRAIRLHQWMKNLLLFIPVLTAFSFFDLHKDLLCVVAFFSFSLAASGTYILNDIWDLGNDRGHPRKCRRPFASASLSIPAGIFAAVLLLGTACILAATVSKGFFAMLSCYVVLTTAYSLVLKHYVLVDVMLLSMLFTWRVLSGAVATEIKTSSWLLAFSMFLFFSLALVKRCSELVSLRQAGRKETEGRDYRVGDLVVLWPLGIGSALCAMVVFGLFISAPETMERYAGAHILWLVAMGMIYWLSRLWIKTARGEMHDDPLVYAVRDFGSLFTIMAMLLTTLAAHFVRLR
jgi:4-hydroxybenzoate polyprenyltransferase/phosphoserine phosphatase